MFSTQLTKTFVSETFYNKQLLIYCYKESPANQFTCMYELAAHGSVIRMCCTVVVCFSKPLTHVIVLLRRIYIGCC